MAIIQDAIYDRLTTFAGLTALVSARSYPGKPPQDPIVPFVWYRLISAERVSAMGADTGNVAHMVEVNAEDLTAAGASDVAEQIRAALQRWSGTHASVVVADSFAVNQRTFFDTGREHFRELQEFRVWSSE